MRIVVLHPGEMGAAVAAALPGPVHWVPDGRSAATAERARSAGLIATEDPRAADVILSICPPDRALEVVRSVAGFRGLYVDANAISPQTSRTVARELPDATYVDGGIIGPPPHTAGTTRLYLSGDAADRAAALFHGTRLEPRIVPDASALKMVYAAWTKGSAALLLAIRATAEQLGVDDALHTEWQRSLPDLPDRATKAEAARAQKGWRWIGEMEEIADTFAAAGQPDGFHRAAAEVYRVDVASRSDAAARDT